MQWGTLRKQAPSTASSAADGLRDDTVGGNLVMLSARHHKKPKKDSRTGSNSGDAERLRLTRFSASWKSMFVDTGSLVWFDWYAVNDLTINFLSQIAEEKTMQFKTLVAAFILSSGTAYAGALAPEPPSEPASSSGSNTQTRAFAGLNWAFGAGPSRVDGIFGVARVRTKSNDNSRGVRASVNVGLTGGFTFQGVRLTGMFGKNNAMAEIGIGYGGNGAFGTAGLWVPYANIGADLSFAGDLEGYAGLHTLGKWKGPAAPSEEGPPPNGLIPVFNGQEPQ